MLTQSDAEVAVRQYLAKEVPANILGKSKLYAINGQLNTNEILLSIAGPVNFNTNTIGEDPTWAFFLDMDPTANWEHPCAYLVVLASGTVTMEKETAPPATVLSSRLALLSPLAAGTP